MGGQVKPLVCSGVGQPFEPQTLELGGFRADQIIVRIVTTWTCHTDYACANVRIYFFPCLESHMNMKAD